MKHVELVSKTVEQTIEIATIIGKNLEGGEVVELVSDVGGGKTTFVRGLAKGAGSKSHVSSPTFTISKVYKTPDFEIVHFDFYRLDEAGLIEYEIQEAVFDPKTVIVVEWSDVVKHVLPQDRLIINITNGHDEKRVFNLSFPTEMEYLVDGISED